MPRPQLVPIALVFALGACEKTPSTTPDDASVEDAAEADGDEPDAPTDDAPTDDAPTTKPSHVEYVLELTGSVTKAQVDEQIQAHLNEIRACYDDALQHPNDAELQGAIVVRFAVAKGGDVGSVELDVSEFSYPKTETCLVALVGTFAFPKQKSESTVRLPFYMNVL